MLRIVLSVVALAFGLTPCVLMAETTTSSPTVAAGFWPDAFSDPILQWIVPIVLTAVGIWVAILALRKKPDNPPINITNVIDADAIIKVLTAHQENGVEPAQKDEEIAALKQTIERLQADETETAKQQALQLLQQGDTEQALELLEQAARTRSEKAGELSQKAAQDWLDIGNIAYLNDTQKALHAYQNASELDTGNPDVWNRLGHVHRRLGKLDEAANYYRKVLELSGKNETWRAAAYGNLGLIYQTRGELDKACESWRESLRLFVSVGAKDKIELVEGWLAEDCGDAD